MAVAAVLKKSRLFILTPDQLTECNLKFTFISSVLSDAQNLQVITLFEIFLADGSHFTRNHHISMPETTQKLPEVALLVLKTRF